MSIHSASFAPFNTFGGPYKGDGDNRKFGTDPAAGSRISGSVNLNLSGTGITQEGDPAPQGSMSENTWTGNTHYSEAEMTSSLDQVYSDGTVAMSNFGFHLSGSNSLMDPVAPDIDAKGQMRISVLEMAPMSDTDWPDLFP